MKLKPIGERVIIKPIEGEERTKSGIYLPKPEERKEGIIETVGTLENGKEIPLEKGDKIIYSGYSNEEVEVGEEKFIIVDFKDIIAKIEM